MLKRCAPERLDVALISTKRTRSRRWRRPCAASSDWCARARCCMSASRTTRRCASPAWRGFVRGGRIGGPWSAQPLYHALNRSAEVEILPACAALGLSSSPTARFGGRLHGQVPRGAPAPTTAGRRSRTRRHPGRTGIPPVVARRVRGGYFEHADRARRLARRFALRHRFRAREPDDRGLHRRPAAMRASSTPTREGPVHHVDRAGLRRPSPPFVTAGSTAVPHFLRSGLTVGGRTGQRRLLAYMEPGPSPAHGRRAAPAAPTGPPPPLRPYTASPAVTGRLRSRPRGRADRQEVGRRESRRQSIPQRLRDERIADGGAPRPPPTTAAKAPRSPPRRGAPARSRRVATSVKASACRRRRVHVSAATTGGEGVSAPAASRKHRHRERTRRIAPSIDFAGEAPPRSGRHVDARHARRVAGEGRRSARPTAASVSRPGRRGRSRDMGARRGTASATRRRAGIPGGRLGGGVFPCGIVRPYPT